MELDDRRATVGLTKGTRELLRGMEAQGVFGEMRDGYRFGIGFAIAHHQIAPDGLSYETYLGTNSLDPDGALKTAIEELYPGEPPYTTAQRLAEWGVAQIGRMHEAGTLRFADIVIDLQGLSLEPPDEG